MLILCVYLLIQIGSSLSCIKLHLIIERGRVGGKGDEIFAFSSCVSFQGIFQDRFAFINLEFMEWSAWATWGQNSVLCCRSLLSIPDGCCCSQDTLGCCYFLTIPKSCSSKTPTGWVGCCRQWGIWSTLWGQGSPFDLCQETNNQPWFYSMDSQILGVLSQAH